MRYYLYSFLFVFLPVLSFAQRDSSNWDRTMDGVHKRSLCVVDTVVTIHAQKMLVIEDSADWVYDFAEGEKTYLEIRIRSTVCSCMDCSYADHILIDITDLNPGESIELHSSNTLWIIWNSMMIAYAEPTFAGSLKYNDARDFSFEIFKYVTGQSWLTYDGIKVKRQ